MVLHTERDSRFIYEAKLFEDHVLVRPMNRNMESVVEKLNYAEFEKRFDEFCGNPERVYQIMGGENIEVSA